MQSSTRKPWSIQWIGHLHLFFSYTYVHTHWCQKAPSVCTAKNHFLCPFLLRKHSWIHLHFSNRGPLGSSNGTTLWLEEICFRERFVFFRQSLSICMPSTVTNWALNPLDTQVLFFLMFHRDMMGGVQLNLSIVCMLCLPKTLEKIQEQIDLAAWSRASPLTHLAMCQLWKPDRIPTPISQTNASPLFVEVD